MPTAVPIQCVEATTPNVPSISGRVVNGPGLMLDMGVLAPGVRFYSVTAITVGGQACPGNFRGSLALAARQGHHGKDLEQHLRRGLRGIGGGVVLRRDLHDVAADDVEAGAAAQSSMASRVLSPPTSGVPVPGAKAGSRLSTSKEM